MKHITIKDIAKHLSVSVSTVSRALINDKNIRKETKEKVLLAAQELGYKPNPIATSLKYGRTNTIGVIVPEMVTPFASTVISGIQDILYSQGFKVIIAESNENHEREKDNLEMMEAFMVDGIIVSLCNYQENQKEYERLQNKGIPIIFYDRIPYGIEGSQVIVDDYKKSFLIVEHLIRKGYKRIVYIMGPDYIYNCIERYRGYKDALAKFRIPLDMELVMKTGMHIENGGQITDELIDKGYSFDAIFAFTDTLAIGAMNRLRELGKRIPEDIGIASFSGSLLSSIVYPQLTTVEPPLFEMGKTAAQLIIQKIKNRSTPNCTKVLDAKIKIRASSGK